MDKKEVFDIANNYLRYLLLHNYKYEKAYVFGSYAKGTFTGDSDIDIAIVFNDLKDRFSTQVKLLMLTTKFDTRIEPHPIDKKDFNMNNPFVYEIMKSGIEMKPFTDK